MAHIEQSYDDTRGLEETDEAAFARWKARALDAEGDVERLRDALAAIAEGRWNVGAPHDLHVRDFARRVLDA